jgi:hypothetical protein
MSLKKVGYCRETGELVLDVLILHIPYIRDDMEVYNLRGAHWSRWTPEMQNYYAVAECDVPALVKLAMVMLE